MDKGNEYIHDGIVIFAGAGCSKAPPSSLPAWKELNDAILEVLWDRLEQYGLKTKYRQMILEAVKTRRDENKFPPDYQAQLMVERAGMKYFNLISAVDSDVYNAVQHFTAILARYGIVKAVVTTNFDRNFERAFEQQQIRYQSFYDEEGFDALAQVSQDSVIPVIKIHGCCSSPASLVDTRKQRLKGRAKALENVIGQLLGRHWFIFCGFSGEDFDHNRDYLGFRDAAPYARGFSFLHIPGGGGIRESMQELIGFYGESKAESIEIYPEHYLENILNASGLAHEPFMPVATEAFPFKEKLRIKAARIDPMDSFNMLAALVESYGDEVSSRYLYDKIWKERLVQDYQGDAISRFLLNHGRSYVFNLQDKIERAKSAGVLITIGFSGNVPAGQEEIYTRPAKANLDHEKNTCPENIALVALYQAYTGNPVLFSEFPYSMADQLKAASCTERADMILHYSFYALHYSIAEGLQYLDFAIGEMEEDCDEPRLSQLLSRKAMLLAKAGQHADAVVISGKARKLAENYHEPHLLALSELAMASCARKEENIKGAFELIFEARKIFAGLKRVPECIEANVELLKIILSALNTSASNGEDYLDLVRQIQADYDQVIHDEFHVLEPEYCYLNGLIRLICYSAGESIPWFTDAITLAGQFHQELNKAYFEETCRQLDILEEVEKQAGKPGN